jgi:hypothetical protein
MLLGGKRSKSKSPSKRCKCILKNKTRCRNETMTGPNPSRIYCFLHCNNGKSPCRKVKKIKSRSSKKHNFKRSISPLNFRKSPLLNYYLKSNNPNTRRSPKKLKSVVSRSTSPKFFRIISPKKSSPRVYRLRPSTPRPKSPAARQQTPRVISPEAPKSEQILRTSQVRPSTPRPKSPAARQQTPVISPKSPKSEQILRTSQVRPSTPRPQSPAARQQTPVISPKSPKSEQILRTSQVRPSTPRPQSPAARQQTPVISPEAPQAPAPQTIRGLNLGGKKPRVSLGVGPEAARQVKPRKNRAELSPGPSLSLLLQETKRPKSPAARQKTPVISPKAPKSQIKSSPPKRIISPEFPIPQGPPPRNYLRYNGGVGPKPKASKSVQNLPASKQQTPVISPESPKSVQILRTSQVKPSTPKSPPPKQIISPSPPKKVSPKKPEKLKEGFEKGKRWAAILKLAKERMTDEDISGVIERPIGGLGQGLTRETPKAKEKLIAYLQDNYSS